MYGENNVDKENNMDRFKLELGDHVSGLPEVKRRVKALKKLLAEQVKLDIKFHIDCYRLECKYHQEYIQFYSKQSDIIQGNYKPTDVECDYPSNEEKDGDVKTLSLDLEKEVKLEVPKNRAAPTVNINSDQFKAIPNFWLTVLKNGSLTSDMIKSHDEPILRHLKDIKFYFMKEHMCFALEFIFSPNEWFTNTVLTKEYEYRCVPDKRNPLKFDGPLIYKCEGCTIQWNLGKDVTQNVLNIERKDEGMSTIQSIKGGIKNNSFFHFFNPSVVLADPESEIGELNDELLSKDFKIGEYIGQLIPKAVLYFTGLSRDFNIEQHMSRSKREIIERNMPFK